MKVQAQVVMGLIFAVVVAVALSIAAQHYFNLRDAAAQGAIDKEKAGTTVDVIVDSDEAAVERATVDTGVAAGRDTYQTTTAKAKRNEPTTAARADRAVPASVRGAYRERRLARERLGSDAVGDEEGARATDPAKR